MVVCGTLALVDLAAWAMPEHGLPNTRLVMASYLTLLLFAVGAGCVAMLASCHLAITKAFSAGFQTGQVAAQVPDAIARAEGAAKRGQTDPMLRLVE